MKNILLLILLVFLAGLPLTGNAMADSDSPLVNAVINDDISLAKQLLDKGAKINAVDNYGTAAIHHAGSKKMLDFLVSRKADINLQDRNGRTLLMRTKSATIAKAALALGASASLIDKTGSSALANLMEHDWIDTTFVRRLVEAGLDIRNDTGALEAAVYFNRIKIVEVLLKNGVDPNMVREGENTCYAEALARGYKEIAAMLKPRMNESNLAYAATVTPDMVNEAVANKDTSLLEKMFSGGVSVNILTYDQRTPLHVLCESGDGGVEMARFLVEHGASLAAVSERDGYTPFLMCLNAFRGYDFDVCKYLLEAGSDPKAKDKSGRSAGTYPKDSRMFERWQVLKEFALK